MDVVENDVATGGKRGRRKVEKLVRVQKLCDDIRTVAAEILKAKRKVSDGSEKRQPLPSEAKPLLTKASVLLVELKKAHREAMVGTEAIKVDTQGAKNEIDQCNLKLQNLLYEKNHLLREIQRCRDFRCKELEKIELVPVDEFIGTAPPELAAGTSATPVSSDSAPAPAEGASAMEVVTENGGEQDATKRDKDHRLMMNRLSFELQERKRLTETVSELKARKKALLLMSQEKHKFLQGLRGHLKGMVKASEPMQKFLAVQTTKRRTLNESAQLLPQPLYLIFYQAQAFKDAFDDDVEVSIVGNLAEAEELRRTAALATTSAAKAYAGPDPSGAAEDWTQWAPQPGPAVDDADEDEQSHRRRGRDSSPKPQAVEDPEAGTGSLYKPHPLAIVLELRAVGTAKSPSKPVVLKFEYLPALNLVTVAAEGADRHLLTNLYPDDVGIDSPNPAHQYAKDGVSIQRFDPSLSGRPYKWAQWLGGLDFLAPASSVSAGGSNKYQAPMQSVIAQLRNRVKARHQLSAQLDLLGRGVVNVPAAPAFPLPSASPLVSWTETTKAQSCEPQVEPTASAPTGDRSATEVVAADAQPMAVDEEDGELPGDATGATNRQATSRGPPGLTKPALVARIAEWHKVGARTFKAVLQRGSVKVEAEVEITAEYPVRAPFFTLRFLAPASLRDDSDADRALKDIADEVNVYYGDVVSPGEDASLLSYQLRRLQMCLDIFTETEQTSTSTATGVASTPLSKLLAQPMRGRDRRKPYVFDSKTGLFHPRE